MNWKREAESDLRLYQQRCNSLHEMQERVQALQYRREGIKSSSNSTPVVGDCSPWEEKQINLICEQERLRLNYVAVKILVESVERGLESLNDVEHKVIDRFYINPVNKCAECLMEELGYEKSQIYNIRNTALYKFTIAQYGISDF